MQSLCSLLSFNGILVQSRELCIQIGMIAMANMFVGLLWQKLTIVAICLHYGQWSSKLVSDITHVESFELRW